MRVRQVALRPGCDEHKLRTSSNQLLPLRLQGRLEDQVEVFLLFQEVIQEVFQIFRQFDRSRDKRLKRMTSNLPVFHRVLGMAYACFVKAMALVHDGLAEPCRGSDFGLF